MKYILTGIKWDVKFKIYINIKIKMSNKKSNKCLIVGISNSSDVWGHKFPISSLKTALKALEI